MGLLAVIAYFLLLILVAGTLSESRKDTPIQTPLIEAILLILALLGNLMIIPLLVSISTGKADGDLLSLPLFWAFLLLLGVPLTFGRLRLFLYARQLDRYGETTEPKDISPYGPRSRLYMTYRYGENCIGRVDKHLKNFKVFYLPSKPQIHRIIPVKPAQTSGKISSPVRVLAEKQIRVSYDAFVQVIQDILNAPYQQYVLIGVDTTNDFLLQFIGPLEPGKGIALVIPVSDLGEEERICACLDENHLEIRSFGASLQVVLEEDELLAAEMALDVLEIHKLSPDTELMVDFIQG